MPTPLPALHQFFQMVSASHEWAAMLGGATEVTLLNEWCLMGLGSRQTVQLQAGQLTINGQHYTVQTAQQLFQYLEFVRLQARSWKPSQNTPSFPFQGGLFACLGYEFYQWCDPAWKKHASTAEWPDLVLCEFEDWLLVHLPTNTLTVFSDDSTHHYHVLWQRAQQQAPVHIPDAAPSFPSSYLQDFEASFTPQAFEKAVEYLKQAIRQGDIYQGNLSLRLQKQVQLNPYTLFEQLCQQNPSPFSGFFKWPNGVIISNSPERLVEINDQGRLQSRPIAGTRGRGTTADEDSVIGQTLLTNEKECAEHLMLVDLIRNDIGKVSQVGSVNVNELLALERYSHVTHLVSNVQGMLQEEEQTQWQVIQSLFPGGTITGCPKIRCVDILNTLEPVPRGFYTGGFGWINGSGKAMDLNILIRSVFLKPTEDPLRYNASVHVGAGIVQDAVGSHEYKECLRKATAMLNTLYSLEPKQTDVIL